VIYYASVLQISDDIAVKYFSKLTTNKEKNNAFRKGIQINRVTVREGLERQVSQEH
jgi:hypothetical protein